MGKNSMVCAGIDTGKHKLDVAVDGSAEQLQIDNRCGRPRDLGRPGCGGAG